MKTLTTLVLIGIQAALPCAAIAETWADDVRSAYDATRPEMEIAMLTPEEAEHIRGIVAEELQATKQAEPRVEVTASEDSGIKVALIWGSVTVCALGLLVWGLREIAKEIEGDTTNNGTWNQGNGTQDNSESPPEQQ